MKKNRHSSMFGGHCSYAVILGICTLILVCCISVVFSFFRRTTEQEFSSMIDTNLNAFIANQREDTNSRIDRTMNTLSAFAALIGQGGNQDFIDAYLLALNENETEVTFLYTTARQFEEAVKSGRTHDEDISSYKKLQNGENVVSNILFSKRMGNIYCFTIGVPVFEDGQFVGALRAVLNAETLVSTTQYPPSQGKIIDSFLCDNKGAIIPTSSSDSPEGDLVSYLEETEKRQLSDDVLSEIRRALESTQLITRSIKLCEQEKIPHYVSITDLGYHHWHLVILLQADMAAEHSATIIQSTIIASVGMIVSILAMCSIVFLFFLSLQKKLKIEEQRYLILEEFSDTVLFDYNSHTDTIHFTPNADTLFRTDKTIIKDFVKNLSTMNIFQDDLSEIWEVIDFPDKSAEGEIRLRLQKPDEDEYFWCLVQYHTLYKSGRRSSIIGKITDITSQKAHEERLIELTERDVLTDLYNKRAAETKIEDCLCASLSGLLFMIDIDDFKHINDNYGHLAGDQSICYVAECLRRTFRSSDILGRIGGDELIAFMPMKNKADFKIMHQKMKTLLGLLYQHEQERGFSISVSIGIASAPEHGRTYEELYAAADQAMYQAKQKGKSQYCLYQPDDEETTEEAEK
ncbi:diguanylate cyclase [Blautia schinkii]|nr:diguanylate cyclase [Blautia schinkii]